MIIILICPGIVTGIICLPSIYKDYSSLPTNTLHRRREVHVYGKGLINLVTGLLSRDSVCVCVCVCDRVYACLCVCVLV